MKKAHAGSIVPVVIFGVVMSTAVRGVCAQAELTVQEIVQKAAPSVVYIDLFDKAGDRIGGGTGFFVAPNLVLTNAHVVDENYSMSVSRYAPEKKIDLQPSIVKYDADVDLALLKVKGIDAPPLPLGTGIKVALGQPVVVYGNNYENAHLLSEGIVRACLPGEIVFSAPTHPGHSGSPLLDMEGRVIGISSGGLSRSGISNMAFAIDLTAVEKFMKSPDSPRSFPIAGSSLFWPRHWKRIADFFEGLFGWIFAQGEKLFYLYLKIASVLLLGLLLRRVLGFVHKTLKARKAAPAPGSNPVMAHLAFALWVTTLICSIFAGLLVIIGILDKESASDLPSYVIAFAIFSFIYYVTKQYYLQHKPQKRALKPKSLLPRPRPEEAGQPAD